MGFNYSGGGGVSPDSDLSVNSVTAVGAVSSATMDTGAINVENSEATQGVYVDETGVSISDTNTGASVFVSGEGLKGYEVIKTATGDLAASECYGTVINNYGQAAETTLTLPTAVSGLSFLVFATTTGNALHIKAGANNKIYLDGTALDDGDKVSLTTPAVGNCATFFTFQTGASAYDWYCNTINGVYTDGGA